MHNKYNESSQNHLPHPCNSVHGKIVFHESSSWSKKLGNAALGGFMKALSRGHDKLLAPYTLCQIGSRAESSRFLIIPDPFKSYLIKTKDTLITQEIATNARTLSDTPITQEITRVLGALYQEQGSKYKY